MFFFLFWGHLAFAFSRLSKFTETLKHSKTTKISKLVKKIQNFQTNCIFLFTFFITLAYILLQAIDYFAAAGGLLNLVLLADTCFCGFKNWEALVPFSPLLGDPPGLVWYNYHVNVVFFSFFVWTKVVRYKTVPPFPVFLFTITFSYRNHSIKCLYWIFYVKEHRTAVDFLWGVLMKKKPSMLFELVAIIEAKIE